MIKIKRFNQQLQQQAKSEQANRPNYNKRVALLAMLGLFVYTQSVGTTNAADQLMVDAMCIDTIVAVVPPYSSYVGVK